MTSPTKPAYEPPDLNHLLKSSEKCNRKEGGGIALDHYLCIVSELTRLFHKFGRGLGLALQGTDDSLRSLQVRRVSAAHVHAYSVELLVDNEDRNVHEVQGHKVKLKDKLFSARQSIVNLNESLSFMLAYLTELETSLMEDKSFAVTKRLKIYQEYLGKYQPLFVQAAVKVMILSSPNKEKLLEIMQPYCPAKTPARDFVQKIIEVVKPVHSEVAEILEQSPPAGAERKMSCK